MKAMIFAAGLGTRLKPLTDHMPKALVPVAGKPMLEHVINKLKSSGVNEIVINVHHFAQQIIDFVKANNNFGITIHIVNGSFREQLPNGGTTTVTPWEASAIIGTESENVGRLVYGTLAEETNPVADVQYEKSGTHVLISKFGDTDPLVEYTAAQAPQKSL